MKSTLSDDGKLITHAYPSLSAFVDYQEAHPGYEMDRNPELEREFSGVTSMQEAFDRARKGLPESGIKILASSRELSASAMRQAAQLNVQEAYDLGGAYVDMGRYSEGTPECMVESVLQITPVISPVITIVSNCNASWTVNKNDLEERGRLVVALIKAVETSGRSTELWVDSTNVSRGGWGDAEQHYRISVCIKRASQPIDMGAVMYAFTDPSMLRALMFNAMHALPKKLYGKYGVGNGYGRVVRESIRVEESYGPDAVYLPAVKHGDNAEKTVTRVLKELGIGTPSYSVN